MIVVVIVGLLAAIAVPAYLKVQRRTLKTTFVNELRVGLYAANCCVIEIGYWPPDGGVGAPPAELAPYLPDQYWAKSTPIGGFWKWNNDGTTSSLSIVGATADDGLLQEIDAVIDDGNLATGRFRHSSGDPSYVINP